jgi:hypothetical protein
VKSGVRKINFGAGSSEAKQMKLIILYVVVVGAILVGSFAALARIMASRAIQE